MRYHSQECSNYTLQMLLTDQQLSIILESLPEIQQQINISQNSETFIQFNSYRMHKSDVSITCFITDFMITIIIIVIFHAKGTVWYYTCEMKIIKNKVCCSFNSMFWKFRTWKYPIWYLLIFTDQHFIMCKLIYCSFIICPIVSIHESLLKYEIIFIHRHYSISYISCLLYVLLAVYILNT